METCLCLLNLSLSLTLLITTPESSWHPSSCTKLETNVLHFGHPYNNITDICLHFFFPLQEKKRFLKKIIIKKKKISEMNRKWIGNVGYWKHLSWASFTIKRAASLLKPQEFNSHHTTRPLRSPAAQHRLLSKSGFHSPGAAGRHSSGPTSAENGRWWRDAKTICCRKTRQPASSSSTHTHRPTQ